MEGRRLVIGFMGTAVAGLTVVVLLLVSRCTSSPPDPAEDAYRQGCLVGGHDPGSRLREECLARARAQCKGPDPSACAEAIGRDMLRATPK